MNSFEKAIRAELSESANQLTAGFTGDTLVKAVLKHGWLSAYELLLLEQQT